MDRMKNNILLVLTALIWGCAFVAQSVGMDYVGPFTFNTARFLIGAIVLLPVIWFMDRQRKTGRRKRCRTEDTDHWWNLLWNRTGLLPVLCSNGASYLRRLEKPDSSQLCIL